MEKQTQEDTGGGKQGKVRLKGRMSRNQVFFVKNELVWSHFNQSGQQRARVHSLCVVGSDCKYGSGGEMWPCD